MPQDSITALINRWDGQSDENFKAQFQNISPGLWNWAKCACLSSLLTWRNVLPNWFYHLLMRRGWMAYCLRKVNGGIPFLTNGWTMQRQHILCVCVNWLNASWFSQYFILLEFAADVSQEKHGISHIKRSFNQCLWCYGEGNEVKQSENGEQRSHRITKMKSRKRMGNYNLLSWWLFVQEQIFNVTS